MKYFRTHRRIIGAFMVALTALYQMGQPLHAATVYWDINGSTAGASGSSSASGAWDAANPFWNNAAGTGAGAVWASGDIAVFSAGTNATGASAITISGTQGIGGLVFEEGNVTLTGGSLQLTQNATINVAAGLTAALDTTLSGGFDLTKTGGGLLEVLANSTPTLTGTVAVAGGTVRLSGNGTLAGTSNFTLSNRGTVTLDNTATNLGNRLGDSSFTSHGGTINFTHAGAAATNYAEMLGTLTLNAGSLTVNTSQAANGQSSIVTYAGIVRNAGSTLYLNGAGLGGNIRNQVVVTTAPLQVNGLVPYIVVNNGTVTRLATHTGNGTALVPQTAGYTAGQASWLTAAINALPTADQNIAGTRLAFTLTLDNGIDIEAGTSGSTDRLFTIGDGVIGIVLQTGGSSEIRNRTGTTADPVLDFGTAEGIFHTIGNLTLITSGGHNIRGSNGFIKSGPGTLTLQINTNTGTMRLNEGIYRVTGSSTSALGAAASSWEFNGGGLTFAHTANVNYVSAGPVTVNADTTITVDRSASGAGVVYGMPGAVTIGNQVLTVAKGGLITADSAYGLTFSNTALGMTLTGSPTFVIDNNGTATGTLTVGNVNSSGGLHGIIKRGTGNLMTSGTTGFQNTVDVQAGQVGWSNNTAATNITESNPIQGAGGVFKTGLSTVNLTGVNTYTGATTIAGGALQALDGTGLPTASNLVLNGGVFQSSGTFTRSLGTGAGQVQFGALGGGFAAAGGPLTVTFGGGPNPLVWGTTPAFVPTGGTLMFGSVTADDVVTFTRNIDLNNTGTTLNRTLMATDNTLLTTDRAVLSGVLSNSGAAAGITKTGNGILELSGANTFTGPVTVTAGTLQFTTITTDGFTPGNLGLGLDAISLGGGILSYIGGDGLFMDRPLTLTAASTLDASGSGTLTYAGAITAFSGTTGYELRLGGTGMGILSGVLTQAGTSVDLIKNGTGTWQIDTAQPGIGDDIIINAGVLILNVANAHDGDDLFIRNATLKLGVDGALTNAMDNLNISNETAGGGILDINGTTGSAPTDIVLGSATLSGSIIDSVGTGSISATATFAFVNGTVYASLTGAIPINKTSTSTVTLYGANPGFTGATNLLEGGTLTLDYTLNNGEKLSNTAVVSGTAGSLIMNGSATEASTETVGSLSLAGWVRVAVNNGSGQTATLNLGAITRAAVGDGTVDFFTSSPNAIIQTSTTNLAGTLLAGWATYGGSRFATVTGGTIGPATSVASNDVSAWITGQHVLGDTGFTGTTGNRTIGSLIFDASAASIVTVEANQRLNISTGGILVTANTGANVASITGGTLVSGTGSELIVHQYNTAAEFVIGSTLSGTTLLTKSGPGTLTLTTRNFASGTITIHEGTLRVSGGDAIGDRSVVELRSFVGSVLDLNNGSETIGGLTGGGAAGGTVAIGTGTLTLNVNATQVFLGLLTGSGTLIKTGTATQEFETSSAGFTGTVIVNQGTLHLDAGAGALPNVLAYTVNGPTSSLYSDQDGDDDIGRINNAAVITLNNTGGGYGLRVRNSNDQGEVRTETMGDIILGAGHNVITAEQAHTTANTTARVNAGVLTRSNQATVLMRGHNLGLTTGNRGAILFSAIPAGAIGGGGAAGSTTMSIYPFMIGDASTASTGLGNSFVIYDATAGIRPLDLTTEYVSNEAGYNALTGVTAHNVLFNVQPAAALTGGTKTINSLVVDSTASPITLTGHAADSLTLASGALLASTTVPENASRITGFASLLTGTAEYLIYTTNPTHTLTIDSALATTGASLTKAGAGTLVLTNAGNSFSGGLWFNQGLVEAGALENLGTGALNFFGGGLRWGTGATFDISARTVTMSLGGGTLDTNGNDVVLALAIGNGGAGGLTKAGEGRLTLNAPVTYTGDTMITGGTLAYGVTNALPTNTNLTMAAGTLDLGAHTTTLRSLTMTGNGTITGSAPLTISGDVVNSGGNRLLTLNNSGGTTFSGSHLLLSESASARTFTLGGTGPVTIHSIITDGPAAASGFSYVGTNTLTLTAPNTYTGLTNIDSGTVVMTTDQNLVGGLRFGSATTVTTTGTLDLSNANATFGGTLTVITNSATANNIIIGAGKTLTVNNNVSVSNATDGAISVLNMTGGGAFVVNGASFTVGANSGSSISSRSFLDMSALSSFTANLTGTFAVQLSGDNNSADRSTLVLSNGANNITSTIFGVGVSATGGVQTLTLGAGSNVLHANTFNLGSGSRDGSSMTFGPNVTGTLVIRDTAGTGRAAFNMGTGTASTGVAGSNTFDVTGHNADLLLGVVNIGTQPSRTAALTNIFSFDQGTLDMTSLNLGSKGSAGATLTTATFNIGGGTVASGPITMATTTTATGAVVANLNITGGNVTLSGSLVKGGGLGNDTANFLMTGNATVLDMGGFTLGGSGEGMLDNVAIEGGTIKNFSEFNGGSTLVKTTSGMLILDGTTYTGSTDVQEGTVIAVGGGNNRLGTAGLSMGSGTVSAVLHLGTAAGPSNQTFNSLSTVGTGTDNAIVSGNAAYSTLTINQSGNTTFNGRLGGAGANQNNLNLVKNDAGELIIGGAATLTGTVAVNAGKLFFDGFAGATTTLTSLTVADGAEFSLRGSSPGTNSVYNFSGTGTVVTVGGGIGATLGFALDGAYNTQLNLAAGQTLQMNGTLTTAIYVNSAPNAGQQYVLINGADDGSIFASGTFNLNPVVFNGGSFTYALSQITVGAGEKWVLIPSAQPAAADVWWKGDLTGIGTGVWAASTTTGTGFPSNWDTSQSSGVDALVPPDSGSIVHFSANGAANFDTTLGGNLTIKQLIFHAGATAISIGSSAGTNTLTLGNGTNPSGMTLLTGAPNVTFSANIALAQAQAWNIADLSTTLTLSGIVSGAAALSLNNDGTSEGRIILTGPDGRMTHTGGTILQAGSLILEGGVSDRLPASGPLHIGSATRTAILQLGDQVNGPSNTTVGSLSSGTASGSAIRGGASTNSTLTVNQTSPGTFHGVLGGIDQNQDNLSLVKEGSSVLILNNINTYAGSTAVREGTLQMGAAGSITQSASLAMVANAGTTAVLDLNGRTVRFAGGITLGGADSLAAPRIIDTATGGLLTLSGNILFDPTNAPLGASITSNLHLGSGVTTRTFTADDSASASTDLTITGNLTTDGALTTTGISLSLLGTGQGAFVGDITLAAGTTDGSTADLTKTGTGTWTYQGALTTGDDVLISGGTLTLLAGTQVVTDDVVADNAGVILNIHGDGTNPTLVGTSASTSNGLYARSGAVLNILSDNVMGSFMDFIILGDNDQGLGTLNLGDKTMFMPRLDIGSDSTGEIGVITGTGSITGLVALNLDNGSISADLIGVGNIDKDNLTVTLTGNNALTGTTLVREGTLILDFSTNNGADSKIGTGVLTMGISGLTDGRSNLTLNSNATSGSLQTIAGLTMANGPADISLVSNGGQDMVLSVAGPLSRTNGTLNLNLQTGATRVEYTGSTANTNGIVGAWLTVNNSSFGTLSGGQIVAAAGLEQNDAALFTANANVTNSGTGFSGTVDVRNTVNSLRFDAADASTITVTDKLYVSSGGILVTATVGGNASIITGGSLATGSAQGFVFHQNNTAGTLTIASNLLGGSTLLKNGDGVLVLSGTNTTGAVTIDEGILRLSGGKALSDTSAVNIRNVAGAALEIVAGAENSETIGILTGGSGTSQVIIGTGATLTLNQTAAGSFIGIFTGAGALAKTGTGVLTVTGNSSMTGALIINQGRITMNGAAGALDNNNAYTLNGAEFLNVQDQTAAFSRLSDTVAITLNNTGGTGGLWLQRTVANTTATENMGAITVGAGHNVVTVEPGTSTGTGTATLADLLADTLNRTAANHSTLLVRGTNLGLTTTGARRGFIRFETAGQTAVNNFEVGGGGAATSTNISIIPWMVGDIAATGLGNSFVTNVDTTTGLRPLTAGEYITNAAGFNGLATGVASNSNVRFDASPGAALTGTATAINSLVLDSTAAVVLMGPANNLEITSGAILAANTGNHSISGFSSLTTGAGRDYTVFVTQSATQNLTINSALTSAVPLVKSGVGLLTLTSTSNAFTDLYLNQGFVVAENLSQLGTGSLNFFGGGLRLSANWAEDLSTKPMNISTGGGTLDVSQVTGGAVIFNGISDATPNASDTLNIFTRGNATGSHGQLAIFGSSTYIGTVIFRNSGINSGTANGIVLLGDTNATLNGNVEIGNVTNINDGFDVVVALGASEQIVDTASITFRGASGENAYFKLMGFTETVAGIAGTTNEGVIENLESGEAGVTANGRLIVDSSDDYSYTGYMRDKSGGSSTTQLEFEKRGTGMQTLAGARVIYTGETFIYGGTLRLTDTTAFVSRVTNNATLNLNGTTTWTYASLITGPGTVVKSGAGIVTLTAGNSYSGPTHVEQGVLSISQSNNLGAGNTTNGIRLSNNATLQSTGADVDLGVNRSITIDGSGGTLEVVGTNILTAPGELIGQEGQVLAKTGAGLLIVSNANNATTYKGDTHVNAGSLQVGIAGVGSSGTGNFIVASGATLAGSGAIHGPTFIQAGAVLQAGDITTVGTAAATLTNNHSLTFSADNIALTVQQGGQVRLALGTTATYQSAGAASAMALGTYTDAMTYIAANGAEFLANWNVAPANATDMDFLNLTGTDSSLSIGNRITGTFGDGAVVITGLSNAQPGQVFNLLDWRSVLGISGDFDTGSGTTYNAEGDIIAGDLDLGALGEGLAWDVSAFRQYGILVVVSVPEPSRTLLLLIGLLALRLRRRKR